MNTTIHTPDIGLPSPEPQARGDGRPRPWGAGRAAGAPPGRWLALLLLIPASCGGKKFTEMQGPVVALVEEAKKGGDGPARFRYCFASDVKDGDIQAGVARLAKAVRKFGKEVQIEVEGSSSNRAILRVSFRKGGENDFFKAEVFYLENGWKIRRLDVDALGGGSG